MSNQFSAIIAGVLVLWCIAGASFAQSESASSLPLRDPTTPLGGNLTQRAAVATQSYSLNSIFISRERRVAIINGQRLREGQVIAGTAGVRVKRILAHSVTLVQAEREWSLGLNPIQIRRPLQH